MESLAKLQSWYLAQCDGEWEHQFGISVETLDNPGWALAIDLTGTPLEKRSFARVDELARSDTWLAARVEDAVFRAWCGPSDLDRALSVFVEWATEAAPSAS